MGRRLLITGAAVVWLAGGAGCVGACNPAIARVRGEVVTVEPVDEEIEICLAGPTDAGSTYGDGTFDDPECWSGLVDNELPSVGDCVTLQIQGESSMLEVEPASDCTARRGGGP